MQINNALQITNGPKYIKMKIRNCNFWGVAKAVLGGKFIASTTKEISSS